MGNFYKPKYKKARLSVPGELFIGFNPSQEPAKARRISTSF